MRTRAIFEVTGVDSNRRLWMWVLLPTADTGFDRVSFTLPGGQPCPEPDEEVGGWREIIQWQVRDSEAGSA